MHGKEVEGGVSGGDLWFPMLQRQVVLTKKDANSLTLPNNVADVFRPSFLAVGRGRLLQNTHLPQLNHFAFSDL